MGISLVHCQAETAAAAVWGELRDGNVYPLAKDYANHREVMADYFSAPQQVRALIADEPVPLEELKFLSPISSDVQLFCQGLNYAEHRRESGANVKADEESLLFMKAASSICGPNDTIVRPKGCQLLDFEIELGLVLKRDITSEVAIEENDLPDFVGGLVLCNDVSARDLMFGAPMLQWFRGKSQRTFCPMGPVLYLLDAGDFAALYALQLELKWNGQVRQSATTDLLIHRPAQTLSGISTFSDIHEGDCLLTGTPGGVLAGSSLKVALSIIGNMQNDAKRRQQFTKAQLKRTRFLEPGDTLELSIRSVDGAIDLGVQHNTIADA